MKRQLNILSSSSLLASSPIPFTLHFPTPYPCPFHSPLTPFVFPSLLLLPLPSPPFLSLPLLSFLNSPPFPIHACRYQCGVPVVIEGETGVGKTALVEMLSKLWNQSLLLKWKRQRGRLLDFIREKLGTVTTNLPENYQVFWIVSSSPLLSSLSLLSRAPPLIPSSFPSAFRHVWKQWKH